MTEKISFSEALIEVRKAHRLLWNFYARLIPACEQLMKEFEPATFYFSDYSSLGNRGNNPLLYSSMHYMLPFMRMDILYGHDRNREGWAHNPRKGDYLLVLSLQLDTAFSSEEAIVDNPGVSSDDFPSPEATSTRIFLTTIYCNEDLDAKNWHARVYYGDWQYTPGKLMPYSLDGTEPTVDNAEFIAYGCELDIEKELWSPDAIKRAAQRIRQDVNQHIPAINWP